MASGMWKKRKRGVMWRYQHHGGWYVRRDNDGIVAAKARQKHAWWRNGALWRHHGETRRAACRYLNAAL